MCLKLNCNECRYMNTISDTIWINLSHNFEHNKCHKINRDYMNRINESHNMNRINESHNMNRINESHNMNRINGSHNMNRINESHNMNRINESHNMNRINESHNMNRINESHNMNRINESHNMNRINESHNMNRIAVIKWIKSLTIIVKCEWVSQYKGMDVIIWIEKVTQQNRTSDTKWIKGAFRQEYKKCHCRMNVSLWSSLL